MSEPPPTLHLPARDIPIPTSVSAEAQAIMAMPPMEKIEYPALDDIEGWRTMIASYDETVAAILGDRVSNASVKTEDVELGNVRVCQITPIGLARRSQRLPRYPRRRVHHWSR